MAELDKGGEVKCRRWVEMIDNLGCIEEVGHIGLVLLIPYDWSYMLITKLYRFTKATPLVGLLSRSVPVCAQMYYSKPSGLTYDGGRYRFADTRPALVGPLTLASAPIRFWNAFPVMVLVPVHPDEQKFVDTALRLVKDAGRLVRDAFDQTNCVVKTKASDVDLVTETDQAVEKLLIEGLSKAFPDH
ncbi:hypothetical protein TELCIR_13711, partial [Teladorsagia circumcincta]